MVSGTEASSMKILQSSSSRLSFWMFSSLGILGTLLTTPALSLLLLTLWLRRVCVPVGVQLLAFLASNIFCILPRKTKRIPIVSFMMEFLYCILLFWAIGCWRLNSTSLVTGSSIHIFSKIEKSHYKKKLAS